MRKFFLISFFVLSISAFLFSGCAHEKAMTYQNRGVEYYNDGSLTWAIVNFNKAIELNPDLSEAYYSRAFAHYSNGDYVKAVEDFESYLILEPDAFDSADIRAWIEDLRGRQAQ